MEPDTDDFRETLRRSADAQAILKLALYRKSQAALKRAVSTSVFMSGLYDDLNNELRSELLNGGNFRGIPRTEADWMERANAYLQQPLF